METETPASRPWHWETAAEIAVAAARWITSRGREPVAINLNVPGVERGQVLGLRAAELDGFGYFRVAVADESDQKLQLELSTEGEDEAVEGSDTWLLRRRYATITVLGHLFRSVGSLPPDLAEIWTAVGP